MKIYDPVHTGCRRIIHQISHMIGKKYVKNEPNGNLTIIQLQQRVDICPVRKPKANSDMATLNDISLLVVDNIYFYIY